MRFVLTILFCILLSVAYSEEHFKRPVPYGAGKVYVLGSAQGAPELPSASYVREHASKVISLGDPPGERDVVSFWDYLRWGNAMNDPKIKQRAGPLTMVIDLYDRVQPQLPEKPHFDTLYCTKTFIYSDQCDYLERKPPVSTHLNSFFVTKWPDHALP
jgi:hypothetical protein